MNIDVSFKKIGLALIHLYNNDHIIIGFWIESLQSINQFKIAYNEKIYCYDLTIFNDWKKINERKIWSL